ncbi:MAG: hypothetical protein LBU88_05570 [Treponema sp.]|nr:hypothetical protein [Treponema sp.]
MTIKEREQKLWDKFALKALGEILRTECKNDGYCIRNVVARAYEAADVFFWGRYERVLSKYQGIDALKRIMTLDGNTERGLARYKSKPCPLRAYAADFTPGYEKSAGKVAIDNYFKAKKCFID